MAEQGKLVVVSGPSGVGKSTVMREVLGRFGGRLRLSVSATTRPPRPGEQEGVHYHFLSDEQFSERRDRDEFVETIEVFGHGHWYGTLWTEVRPFLADGKWVLLEIDVDGAESVLQQFDRSVSIFIRPASLEEPASLKELERRLRSRATESEESIQRRLTVASDELQLADRYQHQVVNETVAQAVDDICKILQAQGL